jgi:hypothetical protein
MVLGGDGDTDLFRFLWDTPLVIGRVSLIKERRSLLDAYHVAINSGKEQTAEFIYSIDHKFMLKHLKPLLDIPKASEDKILDDHIEKNVLINRLIEHATDGNIRKLINLTRRTTIDLSILPWEMILSNAPSIKFVEKVITTLQLDDSNILHDVIKSAIVAGNKALIDDYKVFYPNRSIDNLLIYYLRSPLPDGDILARFSYTPIEARAIGYTFGNYNILRRYVEKNPNDTKEVLINSIYDLSSSEAVDIIHLIDCFTEDEAEDIIESLRFDGYDYLVKELSIIPLC